MSKAARFFSTSKQAKKSDVNYKFREKDFDINGYGSNKITPEDCWEQVREWATAAARAQIAKTPEGALVETIKANKRASEKAIMEAGSPDTLVARLDQNLSKNGLSWHQEVKALPSSTVN